MKLGASAKISQINMPNAAFEIASMLDIDKRAKKMLLKSQSEKDRLIILKRILNVTFYIRMKHGQCLNSKM